MAGPPREIMQGGTRILWGPGDRLRLISKLRILGSIKPLVNFHKCFISCAAECSDNIYLIQSSDKHNQLMQQGVTCWSYFIVTKICFTAIKIIYQFFFITLTWLWENLPESKAMGPLRDSQPSSWLSRPRANILATPFLIGPDHRHYLHYLHVVGCHLKLC